jgi:hypothetical protein
LFGPSFELPLPDSSCPTPDDCNSRSLSKCDFINSKRIYRNTTRVYRSYCLAPDQQEVCVLTRLLAPGHQHGEHAIGSEQPCVKAFCSP